MAEHILAPFPQDIDREAFGHWLSGFTDGEGCFALRLCRPASRWFSPLVRFSIAVRADELAIIRLIHSYFQGGTIRIAKAYRHSKPIVVFAIGSTGDIPSIIAHFDRFPLRAKKARDYAIWRQGALLARTVALRRRRGRGRGKGGVGQGIHLKWETSERERFMKLVQDLKSRRVYADPFGE